MKTFFEFLKSRLGEGIVGIYPPQYGGIGTHPPLANQTGSDQVYVKASRNSLKKKHKKKNHKKKKH
jgi:hypothetical protein